jgi:predicted RNase H-like HicB family nuclease
MIRDYIQAAMRHAHYELIDQPSDPYFGSIPECRGVIAIGRTLEECRENLEGVLDAWLVVRLRKGLEIPEIDGVRIEPLIEVS